MSINMQFLVTLHTHYDGAGYQSALEWNLTTPHASHKELHDFLYRQFDSVVHGFRTKNCDSAHAICILKDMNGGRKFVCYMRFDRSNLDRLIAHFSLNLFREITRSLCSISSCNQIVSLNSH